jgi:hypothetical protein
MVVNKRAVVLLSLMTGSVVWAGSTPSAVTLTAPNRSVHGDQVTLAATVVPDGASGKVTFYDGNAALGTVPLADGTATLNTSMLGRGMRTLRAVYSGDATYATSTSPAVMDTVTSLPNAGYENALILPPQPFDECCGLRFSWRSPAEH